MNIFDISYYNRIRWPFVRADAIFLRVAYDQIDPKYQEYRRKVRSQNIRDYGYAWNLPQHDSYEQGKFVGGLSVGMEKFALDAEKVIIRGQLYYDVRSAGEYLKWWDGYLSQNPDAEPYLYTNLYSWERVRQISDKQDVAEIGRLCKLWVAAYQYGDDGSVPPWTPLVFEPWEEWTLWQYTGRGNAPGFVNVVDKNILNPAIDTSDWLGSRPYKNVRQAWIDYWRSRVK